MPRAGGWGSIVRIGVLMLVVGAVGCGTATPGPGGCRSDRGCGGGEYCERPLGACGDAGRCALRPELCTEIFLPVCGCDGQTYSNACFAAAQGASIAAERECLS